MIKIGIQDFPAACRLAEFARQELTRIGVESMVVFLDNLEGGILRGDIDTALQPLIKIPLDRPGEVVIAALSARENPADLLVMHPEAQDSRLDFGLKPGSVVYCTTAWQAAQLRDFRPDLAVSVSEDGGAAVLSGLQAGACAAIIPAAADGISEDLDRSGLVVVELNPREFVPAPGQGVLAWRAYRDNPPLRRLLKQIHHPEVSACTNVERRVLQLLGGDVAARTGAFVERDAAGNFHAFVACERSRNIHRARLSQSTNFELADRVSKQLR